MEPREELFEQIEAYLNDGLPAAERQAFEQRLAGDAELRRELELHRRLQADYDPGRLQLRAALRTVMDEPLPADPPSGEPRGERPWGRYLAWAGLLLALGWIVWNFWPARQPDRPVRPEPQLETPRDTPAAPQPSSTPAPPEPKARPDGPIARTDPARFTPNSSMEAFVAGRMRSESIEIRVTHPTNGARFIPNKKGIIAPRFSGSVNWQPDRQLPEFVFSFFDNRDANRPRLVLPLPGRQESAAALAFDFRQPLTFEPGLYYFTIEEKEAGEILYAGKFLVEK